MPSSSGFEDFLCEIIGVPESYRGKLLEQDLNSLKVPFSSAHGILISNNEFENEEFHERETARLLLGRDLTKGEVGCALAHRAAAKRLTLSDKDFAIIFEDDVRLVGEPDFNLIRTYLNSNLPRILLLGWNEKFSVASSTRRPLNANSPKAYSVPLLVPPTGTFAYAMNRKAAEVMASGPKKIDTTADWPVGLSTNVEFSCLCPPIADWKDAAKNTLIESTREASISGTPVMKIIGRLLSIAKLTKMRNEGLIPYTGGQIVLATIYRDLVFSLTPKDTNFIGEHSLEPTRLKRIRLLYLSGLKFLLRAL